MSDYADSEDSPDRAGKAHPEWYRTWLEDFQKQVS